jgi:hypothetical protein
MNRKLPTTLLILVTLLLAPAANAQWAPDTYMFTTSGYFASQGATNASILVTFIAGQRYEDKGWIDYSTSGGSAIPGVDYEPVSGTLWFNYGPVGATFSVPLKLNPTNHEVRTIGLELSAGSNSRATIDSRGSALLYINFPSPPQLQIVAAPGNNVSISWVDDGTGPDLERRLSITSTNWVTLRTWQFINGHGVFVEPATNRTALYRLHRAQ